ncbi:MAG: lipoprotein-releasing ABC transporter permease subunit [Proteobacteria bacterium]|nr:lipoprotein-releasing ABC transporter permease subunit [Desulfobacteraceae bacterium]MBU1163809.1 lipoprotein-releasing ABC transporter permease subunit [Pseudomonadota bacterium]MBU2522267.1 lipoprotein-releasing ABC transporter permease subunit [Pseudomonadota bacterium]MBU4208468.1 lipoprotein-releasing ABC transporter permease subunit [Pseudomonadota bacterium]MBU4503420.1 lipoprotein-releasing ABC transporter permease subunit [Pseudomonadota bacterium]
MSFEFFIGSRYLRTKQKQTFISLITILSIAGVTVGVMALIVVIAVMAGFESDLKSRILGVESHIVIMRHNGPFSDYGNILEHVENTEGVEAATPFINSQVILRSSLSLSGAVLRGIDPDSADRVIKNLDKVSLKNLKETDQRESTSIAMPAIILGKELAKNLGVMQGDPVYLISPMGMISPIGHIPTMKRFKVAGLFESGMYEYDRTLSYIHIKDAQKILRMGDSVNGIEVRVNDIYNARNIADRIVKKLGFQYWARDWMQMNQNLFSALKLEKTVMFIILALIVLVAAFNIASTLIMMVMEKTKDIAILKAMGATDKSIRKIFVFKGIAIGSIGTILGVCLGFILCTVLKYYQFIELPGDVYYITTLPVKLELLDVVMIASAAMAISFLATLYPARQASKLDPVEAIRYG